jgi:hypothetical protein
VDGWIDAAAVRLGPDDLAELAEAVSRTQAVVTSST